MLLSQGEGHTGFRDLTVLKLRGQLPQSQTTPSSFQLYNEDRI